MKVSIYGVLLLTITLIIPALLIFSGPEINGMANEAFPDSGLSDPRGPQKNQQPLPKMDPDPDRRVHEKIKRVMTQYKTRLKEDQKDQVSFFIRQQSKKYGYDPLLLTALIVTESSFNHRARSKVGALGLMQIRPQTGKAMASETRMRWKGKNTLYHPEKNIALGSFYLSKLIKRFGQLHTALEAYNHGPTRIARYLRKGIHPKDYSGKVFSVYNQIRLAGAVS